MMKHDVMAFVLAGVLSLTTYSIGAASKDDTLPASPVTPVLTCVVPLDDGHLTAVFGYLNDSPDTVTIPLGSENQFSPAPESRGQPTSFRPGQHPGVFVVDFSEELAWQLRNNVAIASQDSPRCSLQCPPDQGLDQQGQCLPLEQDTSRVIKEDDVHDTGPAFANVEEAADFIRDKIRSEALGDVEVVTDTSGKSVELNARLTLSGPVVVPHEDGTIETFEDKFALVVGGRAGFFTVEGQQICVRDDGCGFEDPLPRELPASDREFSTANSSFRTPAVVLGTGYCSSGGQTKQSSGGYQEETHWCLRLAWNPFRCTTKTGTNQFDVIVAFRGVDRTIFRSASRRDITDLTVKISSFAFGLFSPPFECTVDQVCTTHRSSGNSFSRTGPDNRFPPLVNTGVNCEP